MIDVMNDDPVQGYMKTLTTLWMSLFFAKNYGEYFGEVMPEAFILQLF